MEEEAIMEIPPIEREHGAFSANAATTIDAQPHNEHNRIELTEKEEEGGGGGRDATIVNTTTPRGSDQQQQTQQQPSGDCHRPMSQMSIVTTTTNATTSSSCASKSWIKLNVGGKMFLTTRQTLCREGGSFLARLSQEDHSLPSEKDGSDSYLVDRDSDYFSSVLNYLRHGKVILDHGLSEEGLREEAEFYNLPKLIGLCNERIAEREKQKKTGTKHVYRVLQCHEDELTNVISAMSDGWKFEQLVPIGHSLHASESGHPEYLCVVSREYPVTAGATHLNELSSDRAQFLQKKAMNG